MMLARKSIEILALLVFAGFLSMARADLPAVSGTVTHLTGNLYAKTDNGVAKILSEQSTVESGELLITGNAAYARIHFVDGSEIVLGPDTKMRIERFSFDAANPQDGSATYSLSKGELLYSAAKSGGRNPERVELTTPAATIQIGGATVIVGYTPESNAIPSRAARSFVILAGVDPSLVNYPVHATASDAGGVLFLARGLVPSQLAATTPSVPSGAGLAPGLYVHVIDGIINLSNKGGSQSFSAGQFGFTASLVQPPVVLPNNPGLKFTPPPAFSAPGTSAPSTGGGKAGTVDCQVR